MRRSSETHLHDEVWANIPWVVNERLGGRERERAERHFATCAVCRAELDHQRKLREVVLLETNIEVVPNASLHKLLARIDSGQEPAAAAAQPVEETTATVVPFPEPVLEIGRTRTIRTRWLIAAVVVQAVALTVLASAFVRGGDAEKGPFVTRTSDHSPPGTIARVVFAPETTSAEMQHLFAGCHLQVTDGPTGSGVYSVRSAGPAAMSADSAAMCLRSSGAVRFAEPHTE